MCNHRRPVCVACRTEMRPASSDVQVLDVAVFGPQRLWYADLWKCPACGAEVIIDFARTPQVERYQKTFDEQLQSARQRGKLYELEPA